MDDNGIALALRTGRPETVKNLGRGLIFVAGSVVGGLALAFVLVVVRPGLIQRGGAGATTPMTILA
jgi:hypothetical protein